MRLANLEATTNLVIWSSRFYYILAYVKTLHILLKISSVFIQVCSHLTSSPRPSIATAQRVILGNIIRETTGKASFKVEHNKWSKRA